MMSNFEKVMLNDKLNIYSKGIYSLMQAFSENDKLVLSVADICRYLGISKRTFYKYRQPLEKQGFLRVKYENSATHHGNIYYL
ncbi:hypothetical protein YK48G_17290 [Lentilactobacillus fungorum]|uniref:HTH domain-containing protein n=1 Tax=Lentilactobacillus fungorum TaxID=2201250 RepID=A0ABQ3W421_9LACO|nr:helix-turn-helix domain-containing protein [Lentilactobacillus fungorum]GHP14304.1 hypothetical protein YK48G_17290 [Lentilactobacillus fungorum]